MDRAIAVGAVIAVTFALAFAAVFASGSAYAEPEAAVGADAVSAAPADQTPAGPAPAPIEEGRTVSVEGRDWENAEEIGQAIRGAPRKGKPYVVKRGDTLRTIAEGQYGDRSRYRDIYAANRDQIGDPDRIYPGQELELP